MVDFPVTYTFLLYYITMSLIAKGERKSVINMETTDYTDFTYYTL